MKNKIFILISVIIMVTVVSGVAFAQTGLPGSGWWTGGSVQNIGTSQISVQILAYDSANTNTYSASSTITSGDKFTWTPSSFTNPGPLPSNFQGSAVVSADGPIKAIVSATNTQSGSFGVAGGKGSATYQGVDGSAVATSVYFPAARGNNYGQTSSFYIQNAGTSSTTVTGTFVMRNGTTHTYTSPSIAPNKMVVFSLFDTPTYTDSCSPIPQCRTGALAVQSNTSNPLAGVMMIHNTTEDPATLAGSTRGFTSADFDSKLFAAGIKNLRFGIFSGIQVQNVGSVNPIDITVTYTGNRGSCAGNTYIDTKTNIQPGASAVFNQLPGQSNLPSDCQASAIIETTTSGGQIVALVAQQYDASQIPPSGQVLSQYFAMPNAYVTTKLAAPQFKDDRFGKRTGLVIQNVGNAIATNIIATFTCTGGSTFTAISKPQTVAAGANVLFYHPSADPGGMFIPSNQFIAANVTCGVVVTADQPIIGLMTEDAVSPHQEDTRNYELFNITP